MESAAMLSGRPLVIHRLQRGARAVRAVVTKGGDSGRYEEVDPAGFRRRV